MAYSYKKYEESDAVRNAQDALKNQAASKPGQYTSQWQQQLDDIMGKIQNREKFTYDVNGDALYNQYKDQYVRNGKLAMQDTMGQAAALTGGYGNSYAQQVGQQTYQGYLTGLTDKIPELYQMALNKYQMDGDALQKQYAILGDREQQDYGRYQDALSSWQNDRNFLYDQYNQERALDYGRYTDDRNNDYSRWQDNAARAQAQVEYLLSIGVRPSDDLLAASGLDKQYVDGKISQWQNSQIGNGGSGGGKSSLGGIADLEDVYRQLKSSGASQSELDSLLKSAISDGSVSELEANELRDKRWGYGAQRSGGNYRSTGTSKSTDKGGGGAVRKPTLMNQWK